MKRGYWSLGRLKEILGRIGLLECPGQWLLSCALHFESSNKE